LVLHSIRPQFPCRLSVRAMSLSCVLNAGKRNFIGEVATPLSWTCRFPVFFWRVPVSRSTRDYLPVFFCLFHFWHCSIFSISHTTTRHRR
jgi:hypothetical protein